MRKYAVLVALLLAVLVSGSAFAQDKLTVWVGGHVVEQEQTWAEIIQSFEEATGIEVEYRLIGFDVYYDTLVTALAPAKAQI